MVVEARGAACHCGGHGCWERYASGGGLHRLTREAAIEGRLPTLVAQRGNAARGSRRGRHGRGRAEPGRGGRADAGDRVVARARTREPGGDPRLRPLRHRRGTLDRLGPGVAVGARVPRRSRRGLRRAPGDHGDARRCSDLARAPWAPHSWPSSERRETRRLAADVSRRRRRRAGLRRPRRRRRHRRRLRLRPPLAHGFADAAVARALRAARGRRATTRLVVGPLVARVGLVGTRAPRRAVTDA